MDRCLKYAERRSFLFSPVSLPLVSGVLQLRTKTFSSKRVALETTLASVLLESAAIALISPFRVCDGFFYRNHRHLFT